LYGLPEVNGKNYYYNYISFQLTFDLD